ncbi:MAG: 50S ribosomal protein L3 [Elusimicrobia bacterium RIFOXYA2_FULL_50_26]|nr:MAG: 50S ribosomal protein L3 [Elusimicrobia bacterium RIFOXYA2_FULL_50_26]OGS25217.1 MAG: 50S ribosomal protein L3 [Elusimicrobia bacterium RIFOXYB2_FULL_50_12]
MLKSILGTKVGMTQIFDDRGNIVPVTVIAAGPCTVTAVLTKDKNGYTAVQLGFGDIKEKAVSKPLAGQFKKNNIAVRRYLREFRATSVDGLTVGQEIKVDVFKPGDYVDISGTSIGHGFAGAVKRHGFAGGPSTHGQSDRQRAVGSIGDQGHQHVTKGHRMPGHLGCELVTIQRLRVVTVDAEKNIMLIEGAVPGVKKGLLAIANTVKKVKAPQVKAAPDKKKAKK